MDEPVCCGPDVPFALDFGCDFAFTRDVLSRLDPTAAARGDGGGCFGADRHAHCLYFWTWKMEWSDTWARTVRT